MEAVLDGGMFRVKLDSDGSSVPFFSRAPFHSNVSSERLILSLTPPYNALRGKRSHAASMTALETTGTPLEPVFCVEHVSGLCFNPKSVLTLGNKHGTSTGEAFV